MDQFREQPAHVGSHREGREAGRRCKRRRKAYPLDGSSLFNHPHMGPTRDKLTSAPFRRDVGVVTVLCAGSKGRLRKRSFLDALGNAVALLARTIAVALVMASFGRSAILAAEPSAGVSPPAITSATTPTPDFEALRVKGLIIALPGPQDTIDPDFAGIRSSLASLGIGYIGYSNNNFFDNMLPAERETFGQQVYNGQKPTFFTNNVMQLTYDLSRYEIPDGQIVLGGIYNFDTWAPAGPNALSLATLSYYQTFLNKQVELKVGYLDNALEFWGPFLAGNLAASIFGPSGLITVESALALLLMTTPAINIKINGPDGFYNKSAFSERAARMVPSPRRPLTRPAWNGRRRTAGLSRSTSSVIARKRLPASLRPGCAPHQCSTPADTLISHLAAGALAITQHIFSPTNNLSSWRR